MAERRMFNKQLIDSDMFLDMPATAQLLYFHLALRADDDGFVDKPKSIMRMIRATDDDIKILISKQYLIAFDDGVVAIRHWKLHNTIRADRYKPTIYQAQYNMLSCDRQLTYQMLPDGCQDDNQTATKPQPNRNQVADKMEAQVRLGKDRIGKDRLEEDRLEEDRLEEDSVQRTRTSAPEYQHIVDLFNTICTSLPKVQTISDKRKRQLKAIIKQFNPNFDEIFAKVEQSDFLTGRTGKWGNCGFDWIINPSNFVKIMEGNYDNNIKKEATQDADVIIRAGVSL